MNKIEALNIITSERLDDKGFFTEQKAYTDRAIIVKKDNFWEVYIYGEKGSKENLTIHNNESDALLDYIDRLRFEKRLQEYFNS